MSWKKRIFLVICNLLLLAFLGELSLRLGAHQLIEKIDIGKIAKERQIRLEYAISNSQLIEETSLNIPHPFFAYGPPNQSGNLSFENEKNYHKVQSGKTVVGIFGGSVANNLFSLSSLSKANFLSKKLDSKVDGVINYAVPGGRQPQALNISTIYGQSYNIAINIEGRNEMIKKVQGNHPPYFPNAAGASLLYFGTSKNLAEVGRITEALNLERQHYKNYQKSQKSPLKLISAYHLLRYKMTAKNAVQLANSITKLQGRAKFAEPSLYDTQSRLQQLLRFSCMQQNIQASMGTRSFFMIQPKPQHHKSLSAQEKAFVLQDDFELRKNNYQAVVDLDDSKLRKTGLNIFNLTKVFKDTKETVYTDSCCHMTAAGRLQLIEEILSLTAKDLAKHPRARECNLKDLNRFIGY